MGCNRYTHKGAITSILNRNSLEKLYRVDKAESKKVTRWMREGNSEQNEQYSLGEGRW